MKLEEELLKRLRLLTRERKLSDLAERSGVDQSNISRALGAGRQKLGLDKVSRLLDAMGAEVFFPDQASPFNETREVCFINARAVSAGEGSPLIVPQEYLAVPLVPEAEALSGETPSSSREAWFLVYQREPVLRGRANLLAVRVGESATAMRPALRTGNIVLIDRDERNLTLPGGIWLVRDPEGGGKLRRLKADQNKGRTRLTFYGDNVQETPPEVYTIEEDYNGDPKQAVVGRAIWLWTSL